VGFIEVNIQASLVEVKNVTHVQSRCQDDSTEDWPLYPVMVEALLAKPWIIPVSCLRSCLSLLRNIWTYLCRVRKRYFTVYLGWKCWQHHCSHSLIVERGGFVAFDGWRFSWKAMKTVNVRVLKFCLQCFTFSTWQGLCFLETFWHAYFHSANAGQSGFQLNSWTCIYWSMFRLF
jgi:hypothetical protein